MWPARRDALAGVSRLEDAGQHPARSLARERELELALADVLRIASHGKQPDDGLVRKRASGRRLTDGGEEGPCGWVKDRYGLSWQVTPTGIEEIFGDADPERARRAMEAMLKMRKFDIEALRRAADGVPAS